MCEIGGKRETSEGKRECSGRPHILQIIISIISQDF